MRRSKQARGRAYIPPTRITHQIGQLKVSCTFLALLHLAWIKRHTPQRGMSELMKLGSDSRVAESRFMND